MWPRLFLSLLAALLIAGCAANNFDDFRAGIEKRGHYIEGVPFFRQTEFACGPAALASILAFWGQPVDLNEITSKVYVPELRGTLPMDIETYARQSGFGAESCSSNLQQLKDTIRKGIPVICLLDVGISLYRQPHYVTAIGFDDEHNVVVVHDGLKPNRILGSKAFDRAWDRAGRWMVVITPKSRERE